MIYHVYSSYRPRNPETRRRMALAARTWAKQPWVDTPIADDQVRCFSERSGTVPFIRDLFNTGCQGKHDEDIIVFTNADICVSSDCCFKITMSLQSVDAVYCFRRDFQRLTEVLPDHAIRHGNHYCGSDLYAFRVGWWHQYQDQFPDMLLGREAWDAVLRLLIEATHPQKQVGLQDLIYHERHGSVWENPMNRRTIAGQIHNINLAKKFCFEIGFDYRRIGL